MFSWNVTDGGSSSNQSLTSENLLKLNFFMFSWNITGGGSSSNLILWYSVSPTS